MTSMSDHFLPNNMRPRMTSKYLEFVDDVDAQVQGLFEEREEKLKAEVDARNKFFKIEQKDRSEWLALKKSRPRSENDSTVEFKPPSKKARREEARREEAQKIKAAKQPPERFQEGTKINVLSKKNKERLCIVVEVDTALMKIHYDGFPDKYDEWIAKDSERILGLAVPAIKFEEGVRITVLSKKNKERTCTIVEVDASQIKIHYDGFPDKYDEWIEKSSERILGIKFEEGVRITVLSKKNKERSCTILEADATQIKIHYDGFPDKYDEWIEKSSERIRGLAEAVNTASEPAAAQISRSEPGGVKLDKGLEGYVSDDSSGDEESLPLPASIALSQLEILPPEEQAAAAEPEMPEGSLEDAKEGDGASDEEDDLHAVRKRLAALASAALRLLQPGAAAADAALELLSARAMYV